MRGFMPRPVKLFALALLLVGPRAHAWGPEGHAIVGRIAELRLTDAARAGVASLLAPGTHLSDDGVASWADAIRRADASTGPWHYVDIPYGAAAYDPARDCTNDDCVVAQLVKQEAVLADTTAGREARATALRFIVHFAGDLHQPLHCISRDDDRGGNLCRVLYPGHPEETNLHVVWDSNVLQACMAGRDIRSFAAALNARIGRRQLRRWARGDAAEWAWESHQAAVAYAYPGVPPAGSPPWVITHDYIAACQPIVERQLARAGVRLAVILNRALQ